MRTQNKQKYQHPTAQPQDFPRLFLTIAHPQEDTVLVTESRYNLSATGKNKEEALEAFWQLVLIETLWDEAKISTERKRYFRAILAQEEAFKRKIVVTDEEAIAQPV